mmetsp:Transcript_3784/g.4888  ORF Transcript_3784/g.4888 Transcript_3784/m.4888 type:complete len:1000 (+) Transcript_3784:3-3002(+)
MVLAFVTLVHRLGAGGTSRRRTSVAFGLRLSTRSHHPMRSAGLGHLGLRHHVSNDCPCRTTERFCQAGIQQRYHSSALYAQSSTLEEQIAANDSTSIPLQEKLHFEEWQMQLQEQTEVSFDGDEDWPLPEGLAYELYDTEQSMLEDDGGNYPLKPVVKVTDEASAKRVLKILEENKDKYHACDTEVADIDIKTVGPVGNGEVTCISIYSGPDVDFGLGKGTAVWVENMGKSKGLLNKYFKDWLEDEDSKKVWHNYGFDRHVLYNMGINCKGFAGDTMHMARLWDASRDKKAAGGAGYSLESLTEDFNKERIKKPMKELFGVPKKLKSGQPSKVKEVPDIRTLQMHPKFREKWIQYSAFDAEGTWLVHDALVKKLKAMEWNGLTADGKTMWDFYQAYLCPFGECLTDMERAGIKIDRKYLEKVTEQAERDREKCLTVFQKWAAEFFDDGKYLNPASSAQIQTFLFGGANKLEPTRTFKIEKEQEEIEEYMEKQPTDEYENMTLTELKAACKEAGHKVGGTKAKLKARLRGEEVDHSMQFQNMTKEELAHTCAARTLDTKGTKTQLIKRLVKDIEDQLALMKEKIIIEEEKAQQEEKWSKFREITIQGFGMEAVKQTAAGLPAVSADVLRKLAGEIEEDPPRWGTAYKFFKDHPKWGGQRQAERACQALYALCKMGSIDTMISNFLIPLQTLADDQDRIHCSMNLNTETGRLSARKPNLQNQPALEKDQYKIRQAFTCEPGNTLIVADYGQLELRILAHMTKCKSMIEAFESGGCFHSRTALGMFDYIKDAVDSGKVLLEWDDSKGKPPAPLLKDIYGSERRKAKTLNFSIAYGKTPYGLSKDWGVSVDEATKMLEAWYADRPEVKQWQEDTKETAGKTLVTKTLMGRSRKLPDIKSNDQRVKSHGQRASINTPIQGGAADVVMLCMLKVHRSPKLKELGYKLLLQIHDEVILEGPEEHKEEALEEVKRCMQNPFDNYGLAPLSVKLTVDGKYAKTWYEAK